MYDLSDTSEEENLSPHDADTDMNPEIFSDQENEISEGVVLDCIKPDKRTVKV